MNEQNAQVFRFGPFQIDSSERVLLRNGKPVPLAPKVVDLLLALVERAGHVVEKKELLEKVWPDTFVEEANLSVNISALRKILGDGLIETVPKRGYRFIVPTDAPGERAASVRILTTRRRVIRYAAVTAVLVMIAMAVVGVATRPKTFTVAVLPFADLYKRPLSSSLTDGIVRNVTDNLSNAGSPLLRVKARSLAEQFKGSDASPTQIGSQLGVDAVVSGSVIEKNGGLAIQAQLISVANGTQLWGAEYPEQTLTSAFATQQAIASEVARHLPITLTEAELERLERPLTKNGDAQKLMDRAGLLFYLATPDSLKQCLRYSEQALQLDPTFVTPYGEIASVYSLYGLEDIMAPKAAHEKVIEWTQKAMRINDAVYISRIAQLGEQATYDWDWGGIQKVGRLHPFYRNYLTATGRLDELLELDSRAPHDDPRYVVSDLYFGRSLYYARQYDQAIQQFKKAIEVDPSFLWSHLGLGRAYAQMGRYREAADETTVAMPLKRAAGTLAYIHARAGNRRKANEILSDLLTRSQQEYVTPLAVAWIYIGLGDNDQAFTWMRKSCETRVPELAALKVEPAYDPLRADPRFKELLHCVGVE